MGLRRAGRRLARWLISWGIQGDGGGGTALTKGPGTAVLKAWAWGSSTSGTWKLARNANSQAPPQATEPVLLGVGPSAPCFAAPQGMPAGAGGPGSRADLPNGWAAAEASVQNTDPSAIGAPGRGWADQSPESSCP